MGGFKWQGPLYIYLRQWLNYLYMTKAYHHYSIKIPSPLTDIQLLPTFKRDSIVYNKMYLFISVLVHTIYFLQSPCHCCFSLFQLLHVLWKPYHAMVYIHVVYTTVKTVFRDHCHERPPVLDHTILVGPTFQHNWTCHQRPRALTDHIFVANGVVFQDRFYCSRAELYWPYW